MTEIVKAQRVRIIREIEAAAAHDTVRQAALARQLGGVLRGPRRPPRRPRHPAPVPGDHRRRSDLHEQVPDEVSRAALTRQLRRTDAGLDRILVRYGGLRSTAPAEPA